MQPQSIQAWQNAERLLQARDHVAAQSAYRALLADQELAPMAHLRLSLIASSQGQYRDSVEHALGAYATRHHDSDLLAMLSKRLATLGEMQAAVDCASSPVVMQALDPSVPAELGKLMSDHMIPELALRLLERARQLRLDSPAIAYLIGLSHTYMGDIAAAEKELDASLRGDPDFARSARALSKLKKQTTASNHVDRLRASLARIGDSHEDAPLLYYTLFKELDDLDQVDAAWQALEEGMRLRRRQVRYDAAAETALFEHLHGTNPVVPATVVVNSGPRPIFIVGMPRSGTTLLERMLGAHADVTDAGELRDLVCQLRWMCDRAGNSHLDLDLAQRAEGIDWLQLGQRYLARTQWLARGRAFYTDKMPGNFINIGYIARALPQARILHMVRDPMDTCFSNLKEYFAAAYRHSYDQGEMAAHYLHYRRLMAHWHEQFPGRILDVHYDRLVAEPGPEARKVFTFCGLTWEPAAVDIHSRSGVVATASATQVREPIHQRFVQQWRRYETHLQPMREHLAAGGMP